MLFNSLAFAIFLPIVFLLYWAVPHKYRWVILLVASYYFYMSWNVKYVVLILLTTFVSYICGILVEKTDKKKLRIFWIVLSLIICLGVLFFFKYFNFVSESVAYVCNMLAIPMQPFTLKLLLPVGISFYTFQSLSYVIDVYRGDVKAEKHFGKYALFVSFFPQLVAGPIERTSNLMPQLIEERHFDLKEASYGLRQMLLGFIKKLLIADAFGNYADLVFNHVHYFFGLTFMVAAVLFTFQIYCDFSGYSDIAIGTARLLGVNLMTNFKSPYYATSIKDFWSRWHISLSTWFKDYVYIPLGGNRCSKLKHYRNLLITFLVSGLWHGANWTFVIWGGLHGLYQIVGKIKDDVCSSLFKNKKELSPLAMRIKTIAKGIGTFILVAFAWIFFRADTMSDAAFIITHLHNGVIHLGNAYLKMLIDMQFTGLSFAKIVGAIVVLMIYDYYAQKTDVIKNMDRLKPVVRWIIYVVLVSIIIVLKLHNGTNQSFIYFQF